MQRRPTVGPGFQWPPFGSVSLEQFPSWARVRHCKGGKHGERRVGVVGGMVDAGGSGNGIRVCPKVELVWAPTLVTLVSHSQLRWRGITQGGVELVFPFRVNP